MVTPSRTVLSQARLARMLQSLCVWQSMKPGAMTCPGTSMMRRGGGAGQVADGDDAVVLDGNVTGAPRAHRCRPPAGHRATVRRALCVLRCELVVCQEWLALVYCTGRERPVTSPIIAGYAGTATVGEEGTEFCLGYLDIGKGEVVAFK